MLFYKSHDSAGGVGQEDYVRTRIEAGRIPLTLQNINLSESHRLCGWRAEP